MLIHSTYSSSEIAWSLSYLRNQLALLLVWIILLLNCCVCIKLDVEEAKQVDTHWVMRLSRNIKKFPHFLSAVQQIFRIKHRSCQTILSSHVIKMIQPFKNVTGPVLKCKLHLLVSYLFPLPKWYSKGKILKSSFPVYCLHLRTQVYSSKWGVKIWLLGWLQKCSKMFPGLNCCRMKIPSNSLSMHLFLTGASLIDYEN